MFRRLLPAALALVAALSLSSCLDYDEELTIHGDLSGEAVVTITLPDTILGKYEKAGAEFERSKIEKRLESASGVQLVSYDKTEGRQPKVTMVIKFSSLAKLDEAIAANPPAAIYAGRFTTTKKDGLVTIDRKLGVGKVEGELPASNSAFYKTHVNGNITATNSTRYNSPARDVRYSYQLTDILARQPTQSITISKGWPWLLILGCLAVIGGAAWYGWENFGKKKAVQSRVASPLPGPPQSRPPGPPTE